MSEPIYITNAKRTPIGTFGGSLSKISTIDLGAHVAKAVIADSGVSADEFDSSVWANVVTTGPRDMYTPAPSRSRRACRRARTPTA